MFKKLRWLLDFAKDKAKSFKKLFSLCFLINHDTKKKKVWEIRVTNLINANPSNNDAQLKANNKHPYSPLRPRPPDRSLFFREKHHHIFRSLPTKSVRDLYKSRFLFVSVCLSCLCLVSVTKFPYHPFVLLKEGQRASSR